MKSLYTSLFLGVLSGILIGTVFSWTIKTTTKFRKQLTMKYGPNVFQSFKYGKGAQKGDYPGFAKVRRLLNMQFYFCGGSILTLDKVLTSYTCIYDLDRYKITKKEGEFTVTAGTIYSLDNYGYTYDPETESFTSGDSQMRMVSHFITSNKTRVYHVSKKFERHEAFAFERDLIIVVLKRPFIGTDLIKRVDMFTFSTLEANKSTGFLMKMSTGIYCKLMSFGFDNFDPVLTMIRIKLITAFECHIFGINQLKNGIGYRALYHRWAMAMYDYDKVGQVCGYIEKKANEDPFTQNYSLFMKYNESERFGLTGDPLYCHGTYLFGVVAFIYKMWPNEKEEYGSIYCPYIMTKLEEIILFLEEVNIRIRSEAKLIVNTLLLTVLSSAINIFG